MDRQRSQRRTIAMIRSRKPDPPKDAPQPPGRPVRDLAPPGIYNLSAHGSSPLSAPRGVPLVPDGTETGPLVSHRSAVIQVAGLDGPLGRADPCRVQGPVGRGNECGERAGPRGDADTVRRNERRTENKRLPGMVALLNQAVADAHSTQFTSQSALALSSDLGVLLHRVQLDHEPNSFSALDFEKRIKDNCAQLGFGS